MWNEDTFDPPTMLLELEGIIIYDPLIWTDGASDNIAENKMC